MYASNAFWQRVHFPKENVQQNKMLQMHLMRCQNAFWHQMHFCTASHFPLENVQQTRIPCTLYFSEVSVFNKTIELLIEAYHNLTITFFAKKNKIYNFFSTILDTGGHLKWPPLRLLILASILGLRTIEK